MKEQDLRDKLSYELRNYSYPVGKCVQIAKDYAEQEAKKQWINVSELLPNPLETVIISNGKGWTTLGCLVETSEGYHWAETNGIIYEENGMIVSECESDDLDVVIWHKLPKTIRL